MSLFHGFWAEYIWDDLERPGVLADLLADVVVVTKFRLYRMAVVERGLTRLKQVGNDKANAFRISHQAIYL